MIITMNEGKCKIKVVENKINSYIFESTTEKDEFLYTIFDAFKLKHKRELWNNNITITNDENDDVQTKSYEIFVLNPDVSNLNDDKEFQKLFSKYISVLDCAKIDEISRDINGKIYELVNEISNIVKFTNVKTQEEQLNITQLLKGVDLKVVSDEFCEYSSVEAKVKYIELMEQISMSNKDCLYIILYPEANVGVGDYKKLCDKLKCVKGTIIVITTSYTIMNNYDDCDLINIIFEEYNNVNVKEALEKYMNSNRGSNHADFNYKLMDYLLNISSKRKEDYIFEMIIK